MLIISSLVAALLARPQASDPTLDAWFLKDGKGQSCASCHSVDGIELRSFSEADLVRRISRHHSADVAAKIQALIAVHPKRAGEAGTEVRPLQPSGAALPGSSPAERDAEFLRNLRKQFPRLFIPFAGLAGALEFQNEILNIDLRQLPIGIGMNRLSEDGAHGEAHRSIANWFPDVPTFDSDVLRPELEKYRANPTDEHLAEVDSKLRSIAVTNDPFSNLSLAKYRSLMLFQHELRTGKPSSLLLKGNPYWQIADFARIYLEADHIAMRVPAEIATAKDMPNSFKSQMKELRLPWFWLGWILDPSLTKTSPAKDTVRGDYFCRFLEEDGPYMGHEVFMLSRKMAEQTRNPLYPNIPFEIQYSFLLTNTPLLEREPKGAEAKALFRQLAANSFMMSLRLLEQDLIKTNRTIRKVPQMNHLNYVRGYLKGIGLPNKELIDRVVLRLKSAKDN